MIITLGYSGHRVKSEAYSKSAICGTPGSKWQDQNSQRYQDELYDLTLNAIVIRIFKLWEISKLIHIVIEIMKIITYSDTDTS